MNQEIIKLDDVHTYYGLAQILSGVSLCVTEGEAVGLLGRNGEGKTTTLKTIMCLIRPRKGQIFFKGENIVGLSPHLVARKGISLVPEGRHIFPALSVIEHLKVPVGPRRRDRGSLLEKVFKIFPELKGRENQLAKALSGGQQQMLVIARSLMTVPSLLLLDEPMEGLAPVMVSRVIDALHSIREEGISILFASTNFERASLIATSAYIIQRGRIVYYGRKDELGSAQHILQRYLGVRV